MSTLDFGDRGGGYDSRTVAKTLAVVLPLVTSLAVIGSYLLGLRSYAILGLYVAVPSILAPVLYRYGTDIETTAAGTRNRHIHKLLLSSYLALTAVSIVLLATSPVRPYSYYLVVAALAVVVLAQIVQYSAETSRWPILAQIVLLQLNLVWGVTLKYNYFLGRTDIFGHVYSVQRILESGAIPSQLGFYQSFPLWHILGATEALLAGGQLTPRTTLFVLSGLLYALVPVGVYVVAKRLFDSIRVALAAGLFTCLDATVMHNGMYSLPRGTAAVLFVFMLLTLVQGDKRSIALFGLFALAVAAYHPVSLPFMFVILLFFYFFRQHGVPSLNGEIVPRGLGATYSLLALIILVQAAYWLFFAEPLVEHLLRVLFMEGTPSQVNPGVVDEPLRELANYIHYSALLVFVFTGVLVGLFSDRAPGKTHATLFTALVLVGFSFPGPHLLLEQFAGSFNIHRFSQYAFPFINMAAGYGLIKVIRGVDTPKITGETVKVIVLVVFVVFSMATISNDFVASDNPAVERQFYTNYLSEAEEHSMQTVAGVATGNVSSDYAASRYYDASPYANQSRILGVSTEGDQLFFGDQNDLLLIREGELQQRPLQVWRTDNYRAGGYFDELRYVDRDAAVWSDLQGANKVYSSGAVGAYQQSAVLSENRTGSPEG